MSEEFQLKPIHKAAITRAMEKARHYRSLNEPDQAESICLDVLALDETHQEALTLAVLSMTDQFAHYGTNSRRRRARDCVAKLTDDYERAYYSGIICEREGRAYIQRGSHSGSSAYDAFRDAMEWYEKAETIRAPGNDDCIHRWNSCVRTIRHDRLEPREHQSELPLE